MTAPKSTPSILKLKVTLLDIKPSIWRRVLVPESMPLDYLHDAIQVAMGWEGGHLHLFDIGGRHFGDPTLVDHVDDETRYRMSRFAKDGVTKFRYVYDFGDDWIHGVVIEGREPAAAGVFYPACVAGKRACPPEDCGGPWGYQELLEIVASPDHPERNERLEWIGRELDPEAFSVAKTEQALRVRFPTAAKTRPS